MKTPWISIVLFLLASFLGAAGQFLYKAGTDRAEALGGGLANYLANVRILGGVACYTLVMVCFVAAFRRGGAPSVLYPIYASTFLWAALIGQALYQVPIRGVHVLGMILIVLGIALMGR
jgi:multidrug transporter EmrE-like cation transporter